jgi:hypothetical protein
VILLERGLPESELWDHGVRERGRGRERCTCSLPYLQLLAYLINHRLKDVPKADKEADIHSLPLENACCLGWQAVNHPGLALEDVLLVEAAQEVCNCVLLSQTSV